MKFTGAWNLNLPRCESLTKMDGSSMRWPNVFLNHVTQSNVHVFIWSWGSTDTMFSTDVANTGEKYCMNSFTIKTITIQTFFFVKMSKRCGTWSYFYPFLENYDTFAIHKMALPVAMYRLSALLDVSMKRSEQPYSTLMNNNIQMLLQSSSIKDGIQHGWFPCVSETCSAQAG